MGWVLWVGKIEVLWVMLLLVEWIMLVEGRLAGRLVARHHHSSSSIHAMHGRKVHEIRLVELLEGYLKPHSVRIGWLLMVVGRHGHGRRSGGTVLVHAPSHHIPGDGVVGGRGVRGPVVVI